MVHVRPVVVHITARTLALVGVLALLAGTARAADAPAKGTVEKITVHGKSLEGNLEGDSPDRAVFVYLPPSYATATTRRYPVVYLLHGYGLTGERWMSFTKLGDAADKDIAAGTAKEMIVVNPDAFTKYDGSMYSASPTTGDWETFIAEDLVNYIDSHYRTMATRASRGLGGHSMGGYGTVRIGMKRPDVFSSLYIMSACCLLTDPTPRGGGAGNRGAAAPGPGATPAPQAGRAAAPPDGRGAQAGAGQGRAGRGGGGFANVGMAQAAAWAPNPGNPPDFVDQPVKDGEVQPLVRAKYLANSPLAMIDQYYTNLKKYQVIGLEVGTADTLAESNRQLDRAMTNLGIQHTFETYEGDHTNRVVQRIEENVLPFFTKALTFTAPAKATARK
jgi:S-formylglutathione hydrolase FrmB